MPGTDFTITTIKVNSAVTSTSPQIKFESQEKRITSDMTQSPTPSEDGLVRLSPRQQVNERPVKQERSPGKETVSRMKGSQDNCLNNGNMDSPNAGCRSQISAQDGTLDSRITEERSGKLRRVSASQIKTEPLNEEENSPFVTKERGLSPTSNDFFSSSNKLSFHRRISCPPSVRPSPEQGLKSSGELQKPAFSPRSSPHHQKMPERKHECEKCGISFRSHKTYLVHVKHYCSGKRLELDCNICGAKFDSKKTLSIHMEVHDPQYVCLICSKSLPHLDGCKRHMVQHAEEAESFKEGSSVFLCPNCGIESSEKSALMEHMWTNHFTISNTGTYKQYYYETLPVLRGSPPLPASVDDETRKEPQTHQERTVKGNSPVALSNPQTPPRCSEPDLRNISPPKTTSTPLRPPTSTEVTSHNAFSCIVCSVAFPDVISLQHHLLTTHAFAGASHTSPIRENSSAESQPSAASLGRQKSRKISTVAAPQLSLLSGTGKYGPAVTSPETISEEPEIYNKRGSPIEQGYIEIESSKKKRKERNSNGVTDLPHSRSLKRIRRDFASPTRRERSPFLNDNLEVPRRISCPVVSNKPLELDPSDRYGSVSPFEERTCVPCDIKFSSVKNYRAHKKYYCASRHVHKSTEEGNSDFVSTAINAETTQIRKRVKCSGGDRPNVSLRKRSHLTPLETVRGSSPIIDLDASKMPSNRKSCPSEVATYLIPGNSSSPDADSSPPSTAQPNPNQKKHLCQECNIWYSKIDTYIAHKKYYCESRRKERGAQRVVNPSSRASLKRKSESSLREPITRGENSSVVFDRRVWSPQRNSPSTDGDEDKTGKNTERESPDTDAQNPITFDPDNLTFPSYNPSAIMGHEMLARLSFMHYIAMMRSQEMCGNSFPLFPGLPSLNLQATSSNSTNKIHRRSVADLRSPASSASSEFSKEQRYAPTATRRFSEANRDTVEKRSIIKEESSGEMKTSPPAGHVRGSPLDLSNKNTAEEQEQHDDASSEQFPYPTIDLRTTGLAIKREPRIIGLTSEKSDKVQHESDNENNSNNVSDEVLNQNSDFSVSQSIVIPIQSQDQGQKSRAQQCKNCNARFTSLSTFIAHKKYYCTGNSSVGLGCNDAKAAQVAH